MSIGIHEDLEPKYIGKIGSINIIPSVNILKALEQDYEIMRSEMIYGHPPTFEEIIEAMKNLQYEINREN